MSDDHMAPPRHVCWVETVDRTGLALARYDPSKPVESADVLVLENEHGNRSAGRFIGHASAQDAETEVLFTVVDTFVVYAAGQPLETLLDAELEKEPASVDGRHGWGVIGLPAGWETLVRRVPEDEPNAAEGDLATAFESKGYQNYVYERRLNLAPGDIVDVSGEPAMILAIDRRKDVFELQFGDEEEPHIFAFDDIDPTENDA